MKNTIKTTIRVSGLTGLSAFFYDAIRIIQINIGARHMRMCMCCC